ncbi:MAG TPA: NAD(P)/FAD-dependent oxidoreductase [Vicinamibacterales bacterium]
MYDVIVVGGRCAGAPLARLLAREGVQVLLLDRATFPSEIPHGHFIHRQGPARLKRWGLLDRIASVCPAVSSQLVDLGDFPLVSHDIVLDGVAWGYGPRRRLLDKIFLDAAIESGAEVREGFTVDEYLFDDGMLTGIRGREPGGGTIQEKASIVVGADGRNSRLAKAVDADVYDDAPTVACYYFSYWSGVETQPFELYQRTRERRVIFSFRTSDDLFAVFVGAPIEELQAIRSNIERHFMDALDLAPDFSQRIRAGRREERFYGASDLPNFYRKPYGPGWALVGDAGCHKDPYMALGIADALRDVDLLSAAIIDGLGGRRQIDAALAEYERQRNASSATEYRQNLSAARFEPVPAEILKVRQAVRTDRVQATRLSMARAGMIDPREFFGRLKERAETR